MKIIRNLDVTAEELHDFIQGMILQDIKEATGRTVNISEVQPGYKYKKRLKNRVGQEGSVKTEIVNIAQGTYSAQFKSKQGINVLSYTYEPVNDSSVELTYEEDFIGDTKMLSWNYKIMSILYSRSNKKRVHLLLNQIEQFITDKRKSA